MKNLGHLLIAIALLASSNLAAARTKKHTLAQGVKQVIDTALVKAPEDNEICFAPDEPCAIKLAKFIESAKGSLDVAIYDVNEDQIVHAILVQSKKIPVRVVVDRKQSKGSHSAVGLLQKAGVKVRFGYQRGIMHDKFTVVDGKRVETGSFNYTNHASTANQENQVYLSTPAIVERYKTRFDKMWGDAKIE